MTAFICIDDDGGMLFNRRRVSRDRCVTRDIVNELSGRALYVAKYSESLFSDSGASLYVGDDFLERAGETDCCFVEERHIGDYASRLDRIVLYRWNRHYPSDLKLDLCPLEHGFRLCKAEELEGYSHEKITKETYER